MAAALRAATASASALKSMASTRSAGLLGQAESDGPAPGADVDDQGRGQLTSAAARCGQRTAVGFADQTQASMQAGVAAARRATSTNSSVSGRGIKTAGVTSSTRWRK